ncbi:MAG: hypothetical protein ABSA33_07420, partial [Candidatus Micrarchaeaceae archaeon]
MSEAAVAMSMPLVHNSVPSTGPIRAEISGGKSVQIELRDQKNRLITDEADIKQGINELFDRVNKMGVSDVSIRQIGNKIALDFPGSGALSASELIKASSMSFHVVNEKFGPYNPPLE